MSNITKHPTPYLALPAPRIVLMPVGEISPKQIREVCGVSRTRAFHHIVPTAGKSRVTEAKTWPYKGSYKTWFKIEHTAQIKSWATLSGGMITLHHALTPTISVHAPKGMRFATDGNGVKLVRKTDGMDYHPTGEDFRAKDFATRVRKAMAANYVKRVQAKRLEREQAKRDEIFQRDLKTTMVTLNDSRKAGNCVEGSLAFAEKKLHISREEVLSGGHLFAVRADRLLRVANGDTQRAMAAVRVAWMRETTVSI